MFKDFADARAVRPHSAMCPHSAVCPHCAMCPHSAMCPLIMCPHSAMCPHIMCPLIWDDIWDDFTEIMGFVTGANGDEIFAAGIIMKLGTDIFTLPHRGYSACIGILS